ncbi:MAG: hypothetical protein HY880_05145 [Deltaproteobacteria bacterium]|nr:hypothetical protein [Deltaproteobacteria bacterium]
MEKVCIFCKRRFLVNPRLCNQEYCSRPECQRARKRRWQKEKIAKDGEYRENQAAAQREWCGRNRGYWREYRRRNPAYAERNRRQQRERNRRRRLKVAKMDASGAENVISSGRYRLVPLCNRGIAKRDALIVEIGVVSRGCAVGVQGP